MDLLQGALDMLVLRTRLFGPLHGYGKQLRTGHSRWAGFVAAVGRVMESDPGKAEG